MSDFTKRVVLETDEAEKDLKELSKASKEAGAAFKSLDANSRTLKRSLDEFDKTASKTSTTTFGAFKSGMKSIGEAMTPFNQSLEVGKKLINLADAGLQAYAKTSAAAAREVKALTTEFSHYKNVVLSGVGEAAVALGKSAVSFDQATEALRRGGQAGFGKAYGQISKEWEAINATIKDTGLAFFAFGETQAKTFGHITDTIAKNATRAMENAVANARRLAEEHARIGAALLGPGQRARSSRAGMTDDEEQEIQRANAMYQVEQEEALTASRAVNFGAAMTSVGQAGSAVVDAKAALLEYAKSLDVETESMRRFGDAAAGAFETIVTGSGSAGQAAMNMAKQLLLGFGKEQIAKGISQLAQGWAALGNPITAPFAPMHFKSAALHGAAAAAAGVGYSVMSGGGGSSGAAPARPPGASSAGSSGGGSGGGTTINHYTIINGDHNADNSPRLAQRNASRLFEMAEQRTSSSRAE